MSPIVLIETNKIWNVAWMEYTTDEKLDALKEVIMDIAEEVNKSNCIIYEEIRDEVYKIVDAKMENLKIVQTHH